ncbi:MAG: delta 1-pyrroline-5-carboxylate synthetase [Piscirickettsiaceae bacterium]|nr:delta 1-pyrroline-5-carboxylate synthetase [Piscirickettsiaceae bacterium]
MIVVKLGGSLYGTDELSQWLDELSEHAKHQAIIIVPGGGPFAEQVRQAQQVHTIDDSHAHHMAILAMAQFGLIISALCTNCQKTSSPTRHQEGLTVWLPDSLLLSESELSHSWDITSDSLALWLADKLNAAQLVLVKQSDETSTSINKLTELGVLDAGFISLFKNTAINSQIIHAKHSTLFADKIIHYTDYRLSLS